jgi:hypothetical protein
MVSFFPHFIATKDIPEFVVSVERETATKLYAVLIHKDGTEQFSVNGMGVYALPDTPGTRELLQAVENLLPDLLRFLNLPHDGPEQRQLFWKVQEALGE